MGHHGEILVLVASSVVCCLRWEIVLYIYIEIFLLLAPDSISGIYIIIRYINSEKECLYISLGFYSKFKRINHGVT